MQPKLNPRPGQKVRSGVSIPEDLRDKTDFDTVDDWEELEGGLEPQCPGETARKIGRKKERTNDSDFLFSSGEDDDDEQNDGSEDDDLEIEAPVTIDGA